MVPMRGITTPERVCDICYQALRENHDEADDGGSGGRWRSGDDARSVSYESHGDSMVDSAAVTAVATAATTTHDGHPSIGSHGVASTTAAAAMTEEQQKMEAYYHQLYGGGGSGAETADGAAEIHGTISPEAAERERLIQRWNTVRQETTYIDILVQRAERVEPDSVVEYSRETEALTLEPEMPPNQLCGQMLPMPRPSTNSARYLLEPVEPAVKWSAAGDGGRLFSTMVAATTSDLVKQLNVEVPQREVRRASPSEFVGY